MSDQVRKALDSRLQNVITLGFVTTRIIAAPNKDDACRLAIDSARQELRSSIDGDPAQSPTFKIEQVSELREDDTESGPRRGFTFFPETRDC